MKVAPKILDTGFERMTETSSEELVTDFSGAGSSSIRWTISNKQREIAGSYNFNFIARVPISTYGWIEAKADLRLRHRWYRRHQEQPAPAFRNAPLIDPSDPQAGATLTLEETVKSERQTIFVGRPQALAITQGPGGVIVGSPGSVPELAAGLLQWSWSTGDDIPHTPGYLWAQRSPNSVFFASDPESPLIPGIRTVVKSGDMLQLGVGIRLRVKYGEPDSPPEMTLSAALQINVIVDGAIRAKHDAHSDYVTVGRTDRDVIIFRPEISAAHGHFQLAKGGWAYHHESRTRPIAELVRAGTTERDIHLGESAQLVSGDVISLSERVSLEVIITH